jgi:hypothetical protein
MLFSMIFNTHSNISELPQNRTITLITSPNAVIQFSWFNSFPSMFNSPSVQEIKLNKKVQEICVQVDESKTREEKEQFVNQWMASLKNLKSY